MSNDFKPATALGSGMFQWTAGQSYKTSLGGSFSTSVGQSTAVSAAVDNKFTLGTANSMKWAAETAVTFGKKFEYKDVAEIDFKKGSISILEYSGARCLDLFQASAGLGTIERGMFDAQRAAAKTAMKVMVACDLVMAISNISMSGFGQGFEKGTTPGNAAAISWSVTGCQTLLTLAPILMAFCSDYLTKQQKTTKPADWNPNAIVQTSATFGVFIGSAPFRIVGKVTIPPTLASSMTLNDEGTNLTVFRTSAGAPPMLVGKNIGLLDKQQHISGYDILIPNTKSMLNMTETDVGIQTGNLSLEGKTGINSVLRTGSKLTAIFESIDLTAQNLPTAKAALNASLVLDGSTTPKATLSAGQSPAMSSVEATGTELNLKTAKTFLKLNAKNATLSAPLCASIVSKDTVSVGSARVKINAAGSVTINGSLVRLN